VVKRYLFVAIPYTHSMLNWCQLKAFIPQKCFCFQQLFIFDLFFLCCFLAVIKLLCIDSIDLVFCLQVKIPLCFHFAAFMNDNFILSTTFSGDMHVTGN
jgi:hypothetical protein